MTKKNDEVADKPKKRFDNAVRHDMCFVDVPLNIAKEFRKDVKSKYGNIYWVKLMDLMRKAEAYDFMIATGEIPVELDEDVVKKDEEDGVMTFGGMIKND